jgi:hypothetical protein
LSHQFQQQLIQLMLLELLHALPDCTLPWEHEPVGAA